MSNQIQYVPHKKSDFWDSVTMYAATNRDKSFVDEMAYVMVTLYRTGN